MGSCLPCCKKEEDYSINTGSEERQRLISSTSEAYSTGYERSREIYETPHEEYDTPQGEFSTTQGEYSTSQEEYQSSREEEQLTLKCSTQRAAPKRMERGAVVVNGNIAYIIGRNSRTLYCYQLEEDKWSEHSQCPHVNPGLAIINDLLTAVGGKERGHLTNKLVSWNGMNWGEEFPPMQTPREEPALVHHGVYIIALGGDREQGGVEVFNTSTLLWSTVTSLPSPSSRITATLCHGDIIAMANDGSAHTMVANSLVSGSPTGSAQWTHLPQRRFIGPTLTSFHGHSVVVNNDGIYYQLYEGEWVWLVDTSVPMMYSIVCVVNDQMVVVGGDVSYSSAVLIYESD